MSDLKTRWSLLENIWCFPPIKEVKNNSDLQSQTEEITRTAKKRYLRWHCLMSFLSFVCSASVSYSDSSHNRFLHVRRTLLIFQPKRFLFGTAVTHQGSPHLITENGWSSALLRISCVQERQPVWFALACLQSSCNLTVSKLRIPWKAPLHLFGSCCCVHGYKLRLGIQNQARRGGKGHWPPL